MSIARDLLCQIALSTAADSALATIVVARPHCNAIIANQVAYIVSLVAQLHAASVSLTASGLRRPTRVVTHVATPLQANFVLIGCGNVGSSIATSLLAMFHSTCLTICCRQPLQAAQFASAGARVLQSIDSHVIEQADAVIVACQPGQFSNIARHLRGNLKPSCIVISVCCGISAEKVASEVSHPFALTTQVDTEAVTRSALEWSKEDEVLARYSRAAYAATKTFEEVREALSAKEEAVVFRNADERTESRKAQVVAESFPCDAGDFFGRLVYCLSSALKVKHFSPADAVGTTWLHLMPTSAQSSLVDRWSKVKSTFPADIAVACNPSWLAEFLELDSQLLMMRIDEQFRHIVSYSEV